MAPGARLSASRSADKPVDMRSSVELPATLGPLLVRVLSDAGQTMDALLDGASDRGIGPPGRLSLGPLPPGDFVIELHGAREQRQQRIRIVDRGVVATFR